MKNNKYFFTIGTTVEPVLATDSIGEGAAAEHLVLLVLLVAADLVVGTSFLCW